MRDLLGSSAALNLAVRLRASGTDASGANYREQFLQATSTTVNGARATGATNWPNALGSTEATSCGFVRFWVSNPFAAVRTTGWTDYAYAHTGNISLVDYVWEHDLTTSYDGFSVIPSSGTITGTVYVYGLAV
jgi:hypothetical protein